MATFVLVPGAWEAGWAWKWVTPILRAAGHAVHTPSLTGLGERVHLLTRETNLETHIEDVLGVFKYRELENVTLVGHSYGGMVATGVADRAADQIGSLIYLDAFFPDSGQALHDLTLPERAQAMRDIARDKGEGYYIPPFPADFWHVHDLEHAAFLDKLSVPHPLATMTQPLDLAGNHLTIAKHAYILATGYEPSSFPKFADKARALGWPVEKLPTHHFTMFSLPEETAALIAKHAA